MSLPRAMLVLAGVLLLCYPLGAQEAATQSELTPQESISSSVKFDRC
jgi:hypothetical protein